MTGAKQFFETPKWMTLKLPSRSSIKYSTGNPCFVQWVISTISIAKIPEFGQENVGKSPLNATERWTPTTPLSLTLLTGWHRKIQLRQFLIDTGVVHSD